MTLHSKFTLLPETGQYSFYMGVHSRIRHLHCTLYSQYLINSDTGDIDTHVYI